MTNPDLNAIREGLAGNLYACLHAGMVKQVSPYRLEAAVSPSLQVAGIRSADRADFGGGGNLFLLVQAMIAKSSDVGSQKILDRLLYPEDDSEFSVWDALEADRTLTRRFTAKGVYSTGNTAACDDLAVNAFEGEAVYKTNTGDGLLADFLIATWVVQVVV